MMQLIQIKEKYLKGDLSKQEFINNMHEKHVTLFDYSNFLKNSEIQQVIISDDQVIMTSRPTEYHKVGLSFYLDILDKRTTPIEAFNFGKYEMEDSEMIYKLLHSSDTVFDIGGNIGWYTNHIASLVEDGQVYAFEPIPETFSKLSKNVALNNLQNIVLNNVALSDKKETVNFYYSPEMPGAASAANITESSGIQELHCQTNTVDNFVKEHGILKLDFIKCDVEGAELMVFQGAKKSLEEFKPIVFTEMLRKWAAKFNYHPNAIIELFSDLGYGCFITRNQQLQQISQVDESTVETNFFFLHLEKHQADIKKFLIA